MLKNSSFTSEGIVGPFEVVASHSHDEKMGKAREFHDHVLHVSLGFRALNEDGITIILNKEVENILRTSLQQFFDSELDKTGMETMGRKLFVDIENTLPDLKTRLKETYGHLYDFQLQRTDITVNYDGTLDHPNTPMTFVTTRPETSDNIPA